ncbi:MAG: hypothetical protein LBM98_03105 [Oscillospiraceae bacterium]|nr:hypothetical protein [Oscillospiraceae bacterium]
MTETTRRRKIIFNFQEVNGSAICVEYRFVCGDSPPLARCLLPTMRTYFESEEGQRDFAEWQSRKDTDKRLEPSKEEELR